MKSILKIDEWIKHQPLFVPLITSPSTGKIFTVERISDRAKFVAGSAVVSKIKGIAKIKEFLTNNIHVGIIFKQKYSGEDGDSTQYFSIVPISDLRNVSLVDFNALEVEKMNKKKAS